MKESKTKEEYEEASTMLVGCAHAAKLSMHKAKKAAGKERDDD